jgi:DNA polymerase III delta prime subunit
MAIKQILWTEKYRPQKLDDLIVPNRIMEKFKGGITQHMLFTGSPGLGKTSAAWALIKEFNNPHLYINASTDTGIDVVRNRITDFCANRSIMDEPGLLKIVFLDEMDSSSESFYKALRATMELFAANTRFIATCNYINKIPAPLQSRFEVINFDFNSEEENELMKSYMKRIFGICKSEGITIEKEALVELVKRKFPDLRSMLNSLQGYYSEGLRNITVEDIKKYNSIYKDIYELVFNNIDTVKNYQYLLSEYSNKVDDVLSSLGSDFIDYVKTEKPNHIKDIPNFVIELTKYQSMRNTVIDNVLPMLACIFTFQNIVKGV